MRRLTSLLSILFATGSIFLLAGCYSESSDDAASDNGAKDSSPPATAPDEGGSDAE